MLVHPFHCICPFIRQALTIKPRAQLCDQACKGSFISFMRFSKINNILAAAAQTKQNMQMELGRRTVICYSSFYYQQIRWYLQAMVMWCSLQLWQKLPWVNIYMYVKGKFCLLLLFLWFCTSKSWNCWVGHIPLPHPQPSTNLYVLRAKITHFQLKDGRSST